MASGLSLFCQQVRILEGGENHWVDFGPALLLHPSLRGLLLQAPVPQGSTLSTPSVAALADSVYNGTLEGAYSAAYQAASKADISGLPICSRLWGVFRRPPPVIELPLSDETDQKVQPGT